MLRAACNCAWWHTVAFAVREAWPILWHRDMAVVLQLGSPKSCASTISEQVHRVLASQYKYMQSKKCLHSTFEIELDISAQCSIHNVDYVHDECIQHELAVAIFAPPIFRSLDPRRLLLRD